LGAPGGHCDSPTRQIRLLLDPFDTLGYEDGYVVDLVGAAEVDLLLTFLGDGQPGNDDIPLVGLKTWDEGLECAHDELDLVDTHPAGDLFGDIDVEANDVVGLVDEAVRRIRLSVRHAQDAVGPDLLQDVTLAGGSICREIVDAGGLTAPASRRK